LHDKIRGICQRQLHDVCRVANAYHVALHRNVLWTTKHPVTETKFVRHGRLAHNNVDTHVDTCAQILCKFSDCPGKMLVLVRSAAARGSKQQLAAGCSQRGSTLRQIKSRAAGLPAWAATGPETCTCWAQAALPSTSCCRIYSSQSCLQQQQTL
jgi:hypothetical protein